MSVSHRKIVIPFFVALLFGPAARGEAESVASEAKKATSIEGPLVVEATAYNSVPDQTEGDPSVAAWGDRLRPGVNAVAVSDDLLDLGLVRGTRVRIEGLSGEFLVLDRMHSRWRRSIDIYMGKDVDAALDWGRKDVRIYWRSPDPS